jgi:hypothetical protein
MNPVLPAVALASYLSRHAKQSEPRRLVEASGAVAPERTLSA